MHGSPPDLNDDTDITGAARVLVADDDAASRRFLCDGLASLGAQPKACNDGTAALKFARAETFDLLLLDCHMPGAGAWQILTALRGDIDAASQESLAVATSAELVASERGALLAAGFSELLLKPCTLAHLRRVLTLVHIADPAACPLDDGSALSTTGDAATMRALRLLLREELAQLSGELEPLSRDPVGFNDRLHRLRASCGFCGATALSAQTIVLQRQLQEGVRHVSLARFRHALTATLQALDS